MGVYLNSERKGVSILWDNTDDQDVTVYATGEQGDVHNKLPQKNTGEAGLFYPANFKGESTIEIKNAAGEVVDEGVITV